MHDAGARITYYDQEKVLRSRSSCGRFAGRSSPPPWKISIIKPSLDVHNSSKYTLNININQSNNVVITTSSLRNSYKHAVSTATLRTTKVTPLA